MVQELPEPFTATDLTGPLGINLSPANHRLYALQDLGAVERARPAPTFGDDVPPSERRPP